MGLITNIIKGFLLGALNEIENYEKRNSLKRKAEADRLAREKAEADRLAREKAEADRLAREKAEADRLTREKVEVEVEQENINDKIFEQARLDGTIVAIKEFLNNNTLFQNIQHIRSVERGSWLDERRTEHGYITGVRARTEGRNLLLLEENLPEPYFARFDYLDSASIENSIYIGKIGFQDKKYQITDWRAPICSAFYKESLDFETKYGNQIINEIILKRNIQIKNGKVFKIYDKIASNFKQDKISDKYLLSRLSSGATLKMKEIVATIQGHQDEVIRKDVSKPILIQGIAGSGKTVVALHRLAYLAFTYKFTSKDLLIIGPNKIYLNYISEVLPLLGENEIVQLTLKEFSEYVHKENEILYEFEDDLNSIPDLIGIFEDFIDKQNDDYFNAVQPHIIEYDGIIKKYYPRKNLSNVPLEKRKTLFLEILKEQVVTDFNLRKSDSTEFIKNYTKDSIKQPSYNIENLAKRFMALSGPLNQNDYHALIILLTDYIYGMKKYEHIIIDEAQDFSPFVFYSIKRALKNPNSFTILGDVCQSITNVNSDWAYVQTIFKDIQTITFRYSYRSSDEIVEFTNKLLNFILPKEQFDKYSPKTIGRKLAISNFIETEKSLIDLIDEIPSDYRIIAVICKDQEECNEVYEQLNSVKNAKKVILINNDNESISNGLIVLPVQIARGLEFDYVIIPETKKYKNNKFDGRLLYIAMSRAMHQLKVIGDLEHFGY